MSRRIARTCEPRSDRSLSTLMRLSEVFLFIGVDGVMNKNGYADSAAFKSDLDHHDAIDD